MLKITVNSEQETQKIASRLAALLQPGDVLLLDGQLGAGKTTFTKGLAKGLGITRNIKSPTFTLIREYQQGRLPLYHMDVYRLEESGGADLGLDEYLNGQGVCVIEWSQFIGDELPAQNLVIHFQKDEVEFDKRTLVFEANGARYEQLLTNLTN